MSPSNRRVEFTSLLKEYGAFIGLPALALNAHGCARLRLESCADVNLEVDASGSCMHLYAVLGPVPPGPNENLYRKLLQANSFGVETCGATLSIDPVQNEFLLCQRLGAGIADVPSFSALMDSFAATARKWGGSLAAFTTEKTDHVFWR